MAKQIQQFSKHLRQTDSAIVLHSNFGDFENFVNSPANAK